MPNTTETQEIVQIEEITAKINAARSKLDVNAIRNLIVEYPEPEVVEALETLSNDQLLFFIKSLKSEDIATWFNYLSTDKQERLIADLPNPDLQKVINDLDSDELVDIIEELPPELVKRILTLSSPQTRRNVNSLLSYHDDEAGSIMNVEFIELRSSWSVGRAIEEIKTRQKEVENYNVYYAVNEKGAIVGRTSLSDLVFQKDWETKLSDIVDSQFLTISPKDNVETVARLFEKYNKEAVPVVTTDQRILGIISDNDIVDLVIEEATEDINRLHGIGELKYSYMKASIWQIFRSRIFWLSLLMIAATFTTIVIEQFQILGEAETMGISTALLVPIIPVITDSSGNAGGQASASVIRSLTLGEATPRESRFIFWKEFRASLLIGLTLCLLNFLRLLIYYLIFKPENSIREQSGGAEAASLITRSGLTYFQLGVIIAAAASVALMVSIVLSKIIGAMLPIVATKMRIDPTVMSGPLVTTIVDTSSMAIFFGIGIGTIILLTR